MNAGQHTGVKVTHKYSTLKLQFVVMVTALITLHALHLAAVCKRIMQLYSVKFSVYGYPAYL